MVDHVCWFDRFSVSEILVFELFFSCMISALVLFCLLVRCSSIHFVRDQIVLHGSSSWERNILDQDTKLNLFGLMFLNEYRHDWFANHVTCVYLMVRCGPDAQINLDYWNLGLCHNWVFRPALILFKTAVKTLNCTSCLLLVIISRSDPTSFDLSFSVCLESMLSWIVHHMQNVFLKAQAAGWTQRSLFRKWFTMRREGFTLILCR